MKLSDLMKFFKKAFLVKGICENCAYFDSTFCKRYPPILRRTIEIDIRSWSEFTYPEVGKNDWCGEFKIEKS